MALLGPLFLGVSQDCNKVLARSQVSPEGLNQGEFEFVSKLTWLLAGLTSLWDVLGLGFWLAGGRRPPSGPHGPPSRAACLIKVSKKASVSKVGVTALCNVIMSMTPHRLWDSIS